MLIDKFAFEDNKSKMVSGPDLTYKSGPTSEKFEKRCSKAT